MSTPFRRVVDDLTDGCGCACHTGIGYNSACSHCIVPVLAIGGCLAVERLHTVTDPSGACTLPCLACQNIMRARLQEPDR